MHTHMITRLLTWLFLGALALPAAGQDSPVLTDYIRQAMTSSHLLRGRQLSVEQSRLALEEARRLNLPEVGFGVSYTLAQGGRDIAFPVGDLLNPVYSTLNELTQSNAFPQIPNVSEQLLPNNFYDARFRIRQPIVNPEIRYNRLIKGAQADLAGIDLQRERRTLVRDIKLAYFQYLQATEAVGIYEQALELLAESRRVNESLVRNDKAIPSVLVRTDAEVAEVRARRAEAERNRGNAAAYFNQLIGRPLDEPIAVDTSLISGIPGAEPARREELDQLAKAREINQYVADLERAYRTPNVGVQLDLGSQGFDLQWGGYALLGLSIEMPIWTGGRNKLQVQQAVVAGHVIEEQLKQTESLIALETQTARNALAAEEQIFDFYQAQLAGARRFYDDTFRRYREGVSNYIELLDARTQLTTLEVRRSIARYSVLARQAELERALATYQL